MNRRSFLATVAALVAAPAVVKAENIMRVRVIVPPPRRVMVIHDKLEVIVGRWQGIVIHEGRRPPGTHFLDGVQWSPEEQAMLRNIAAHPLALNRIVR